ncbi:MAG: inositol monophosphatase family protein [Candidatus Thermoplasmatota archaeon]|jgi:fructose-1,6-bisphosphatase/inositol monophosphatase family enzyme|nr:inositol monophosphatase family protein [Candidatus Thermoplasmatota archaeon]
MDEEIKLLANKIVDKICRKVRRSCSTEFHKLGVKIGVGADGTPTKYVDKIAEDVALDVLGKSDVKVDLLSEEAGFIDNGGRYVFVLDPVDGTRNACRGIPLYSVSLGVGKSMLSDVEYGIVKSIPTGDVFIAEKGHGVFFNKKRVCVPDYPDKDVLSSLALGKNFDKLTLSLAQKDYVRSLGCASLEMCMVTVGALDFYVVGREYLRVTDIAASTLVVREAGGIVTNARGAPLDMPLSLDECTSVIAACNNELVKRIVSFNVNI